METIRSTADKNQLARVFQLQGSRMIEVETPPEDKNKCFTASRASVRNAKKTSRFTYQVVGGGILFSLPLTASMIVRKTFVDLGCQRFRGASMRKLLAWIK